MRNIINKIRTIFNYTHTSPSNATVEPVVTILDEIAAEYNFEIIETNLGRALIGLDDFAQAEELSVKYNLNIELFLRENYTDIYRYNGKATQAMEITADSFGDCECLNWSEEAHGIEVPKDPEAIWAFNKLNERNAKKNEDEIVIAALIYDDDLEENYYWKSYYTGKKITMKFAAERKITVIGLRPSDYSNKEKIVIALSGIS